MPHGGIVHVEIAAVDDGRVGYTWVDGVSVTKMDEGESIPTAKVATSLSVSVRDGRPLPIFTNEPATVKVVSKNLEVGRSYQLTYMVTDYWDQPVEQIVVSIDGAKEKFVREFRIKKPGWYTVLASLAGAQYTIQQGTKLAVLDIDYSRIPDRDTLFGLWLPYYPSNVKQLGITLVNTLMTWSQIEPSSGQFN